MATFFDFVVNHWLILLSVYVVLSARVVWRFDREVVQRTDWFYRLRHVLHGQWAVRQVRFIGGAIFVLLRLLQLLLLFVPAPVLGFVLGCMDAKQRRRIAEVDRETEEQSRLAIKRKLHENEARAQVRKEWFVANPPKLYFNTVAGITAIVRPADYVEAQAFTQKRRRDGFWERDNILCPWPQTFIFINKQGDELIRAIRQRGEHVRMYKVAGWFSDLDDLVERHEIELVRADDLFIPWVNESLVSFAEQGNLFRDCYGAGYAEFVLKQAPAELQPLR